MVLANKRKTPKRLLINISEELHKNIKMRATFRNVSIKDYVIQAVIERIVKEKQYE